MKIGHYDSELWERGGLANYIRRVGDAQSSQGHSVVYFSLHPPKDRTVELNPFIPVLNTVELFAQAESMGLDILHVHRDILPPLPSRVPLIRTLHGHQPYCPSGTRYLKRSQKPCNRAYHPLSCLWGHAVDRCGSIRPKNLQNNFRNTQIEREILSQIPVMTVSNFLKTQMIRSGYPPEKVQALHLFAPNLGNCGPPPSQGTPHFLFVGRIAKEKGLDWLLQAFKQVTEPIHLDIAGEGESLGEIQTLTRELGLEDKVTFHGWVNAQTVSELIQSSRALIFPSVWHEPAGLVAFEAMANARAVIISRVGGIPEIIQTGVNGIVVEPWDVQELAKAIQTLANNLENAKLLGQQGYDDIKENFTLDKHLSKLMAIYIDIIDIAETTKQKNL